VEGTMFELVDYAETTNMAMEEVSIVTAILAYIPPFGVFGFHRYYTNNLVRLEE